MKIMILSLFFTSLLWGQCAPEDSLALQKQAEVMLQWPLSHGFPFAQVVRAQAPACDLILQRGEAWVWGRLKRLEEGKTKIEVIETLSLIVPGEPVVLRNLERARNRLRRSGWFMDVSSPQLFRAKNRNQLLPAFSIQEGNQSSAEGWVSYQSSENGEESPWSGRALVDLQNIAGSGRSLRVLGETGNQQRTAEISYREPFPFGTRAWLDFAGGIWQEDTTSRKVWGQLDMTFPIDFEWDFVMGGGSSVSEQESQEVISRWGSMGAKRDGRDKLPLAERGWMWSTQWVAGNRKLHYEDAPDSSMAFAKTSVDLGVWLPLWKKLGWVNQVAAEAIWPRKGQYLETEQIALGGERLAGYWPGSLRTTAYTHLWTALQWNWKVSQVQIFAEGANFETEVVTERVTRLSYGISWKQELQDVALGVKLAWSEEASAGDALLSMQLLTRF